MDIHAKWNLVIVRRPDGQKGWVKLPLRWTEMDGGADVCLVGDVSAVDQGSGEERAVVGSVRETGDDSPDAQSTRTQRGRC